MNFKRVTYFLPFPLYSFKVRLSQSQINHIKDKYNKGLLTHAETKEYIDYIIEYSIYTWKIFSKVPCNTQAISIFKSQLNIEFS